MKKEFKNAARRARLFENAGCSLIIAQDVPEAVREELADYLQNSQKAEVINVEANGTIVFATAGHQMTRDTSALIKGWTKQQKGGYAFGSAESEKPGTLERLVNWAARTFDKEDRALQKEVKAIAARLKA